MTEVVRWQGPREAVLPELLAIWRRSVLATHAFLTPAEVERIAEYVPALIAGVQVLLVARQAGRPVGFAGAAGNRLEMLFLSPEARGRGLGAALAGRLIREHGVREVCVNEQNPRARGFYEHLGFRVYRRTDRDEQGGPYPLLYLRLEEETPPRTE